MEGAHQASTARASSRRAPRGSRRRSYRQRRRPSRRRTATTTPSSCGSSAVRARSGPWSPSLPPCSRRPDATNSASMSKFSPRRITRFHIRRQPSKSRGRFSLRECFPSLSVHERRSRPVRPPAAHRQPARPPQVMSCQPTCWRFPVLLVSRLRGAFIGYAGPSPRGVPRDRPTRTRNISGFVRTYTPMTPE